jgi:5-methylcytosine-specific restriction endonuclease McrA
MPDNRQFAFQPGVKERVIKRQQGICGGCCRSIRSEGFAHHVIPEQCGRYNLREAAFLTTDENCVVLCGECHYQYHERGNYANGAVANPEYFRNSHGPIGAALHRQWCAVINAQWRRIFPGLGT